MLGVVSGQRALARCARVHRRPRRPAARAGANDNGSGTGALVELARTLVGSVTQTSLVFASVDGTTAESAGARGSPRIRPAACACAPASRCAAWAGPAPLVLRLAGDGHRLPAAGWLRTVEQALRDEGVEAAPPSLGRQVTGLVAPAATAIRLRSSAAVRRRRARRSRPGESSATRHPRAALVRRSPRPRRHGRALAALAFDTGPRPASLGSSYLVSSDRVLRGWTLQLFLVALLVPPIFALSTRCARPRARRPALDHGEARALAGRGLAIGLLAIRLLGATGVLADAHSPPFAGNGGGVSLWQVVFPLALGVGCGALVARRCRSTATAPAPAAISARTYAARRRRARLRRQPLSARAGDPRAAPLAAAPVTARLGARRARPSSWRAGSGRLP